MAKLAVDVDIQVDTLSDGKYLLNTNKYIVMPWWAEPWTHMVVILGVSSCVHACKCLCVPFMLTLFTIVRN